MGITVETYTGSTYCVRCNICDRVGAQFGNIATLNEDARRSGWYVDSHDRFGTHVCPACLYNLVRKELANEGGSSEDQ